MSNKSIKSNKSIIGCQSGPVQYPKGLLDYWTLDVLDFRLDAICGRHTATVFDGILPPGTGHRF